MRLQPEVRIDPPEGHFCRQPKATGLGFTEFRDIRRGSIPFRSRRFRGGERRTQLNFSVFPGRDKNVLLSFFESVDSETPPEDRVLEQRVVILGVPQDCVVVKDALSLWPWTTPLVSHNGRKKRGFATFEALSCQEMSVRY
jgi:hypothetical protein